MAGSSAISGFGTQLIWNYLRVLELQNIGGPSESRDPIEVTHHTSPDSFREFIPGVAAGGDVTIEGNYITTDELGQINFHSDLQSATKREAWIVLPMAVGVSMVFDAIAQGFAGEYPFDDKMSISGTLRITGKPTLLTVQSAGMTDLTGIEENAGAALVISPAISPSTYAYTCTVNTASTWVKLTVTAAGHTIYVQGTSQTSGVQGGEIALGPAGTDTEIFIMVYETDESPRLYVLTVTRP